MIVYIIIIAAFQTQYNINMAFSMSGVWIPHQFCILYLLPTGLSTAVYSKRLLKFYLILFASTFASRLFQALTLCTPFYKRKMFSLQGKGLWLFFRKIGPKGGGGGTIM